MRVHFYSPRSLDPFDWRTPDEQGIGNSETSHIEMALRLAAKGHDVWSYTPGLPDGPNDHGGVKWRTLDEADWSQSGVWVLYRCPDAIDHFMADHPDQLVWLMMQDTHYADSAAGDRPAKIDRVLVLCEGQRDFIASKFPALADKLTLTSNGIRVDLIDSIEREAVPPRSNHRMHFSSSPDRGLKVILERIFPRAREIVTDLELHIYYGWNNVDKLMQTEDGKAYFGPNKAETEALCQQPGVTWHGRIGQRDLTREWLKAGLWVFPSTYPETGCATGMEAMALGAIPIVHPLWAVAEHTNWGTQIHGGDPYTDPLTQARYVAEIVKVCAMDVTMRERYRAEMMADARTRWSWDNWVPQWEALAREVPVCC